MRIFKCALASAVAAASSLVVLQGDAEAKIRCNGRYQIVQGNEISTPYCEDNYLAKVARGYGSKVSARAIRQNPSVKEEVCRFVGHDTRVQDICAGYRNNDSGRGGWN